MTEVRYDEFLGHWVVKTVPSKSHSDHSGSYQWSWYRPASAKPVKMTATELLTFYQQEAFTQKLLPAPKE